MRLSLIIPAYNEALRLDPTLRMVEEYLTRQNYSAEVIVVDDGSHDGTADVARNWAATAPVSGRVLRLDTNRGKGNAVRAGMQSASGDFRVFYDADASTPIEELEKLWPHFEQGADIVIGSRALAASALRVRQAWYREQMGRVFNLLLRFFRLTSFRDTQCGFKGFRANAAEAVFGRLTRERFSFDAEVLFIAQRLGYSIVEVPITWSNAPASQVHPLRDSLRMMMDILIIRLNALRGAYK